MQQANNRQQNRQELMEYERGMILGLPCMVTKCHSAKSCAVLAMIFALSGLATWSLVGRTVALPQSGRPRITIDRKGSALYYTDSLGTIARPTLGDRALPNDEYILYLLKILLAHRISLYLAKRF